MIEEKEIILNSDYNINKLVELNKRIISIEEKLEIIINTVNKIYNNTNSIIF